MENKRTGGGECRAGTGSPRKTFALARWMLHEIIPYQRQISADGSKPRAEARAWASFLVKLIILFFFFEGRIRSPRGLEDIFRAGLL